MSPGERRALVERDDPDLSVAAQCRLLNVARSTLYYQPAPMDPDDLALMRRMDELYTKWPFYGSRRMVATLRQDGLNEQHLSVRWSADHGNRWTSRFRFPLAVEGEGSGSGKSRGAVAV